MRIKFEMIADPVARAKLESLDFDPDIAERLALELLELLGAGTDLGSIWTNFQYDEADGNKVVSYEITGLPACGSALGLACHLVDTVIDE
jgi:hypothetical protein